jgi:hypothetical protein
MRDSYGPELPDLRFLDSASAHPDHIYFGRCWLAKVNPFVVSMSNHERIYLASMR